MLHDFLFSIPTFSTWVLGAIQRLNEACKEKVTQVNLSFRFNQ